jgi:hypothetical protein
MTALIARAGQNGIHVMIAGIEAGNAASIALHEKLGFRNGGTFREVGTKFGRWLDLTFMELTCQSGRGAALKPSQESTPDFHSLKGRLLMNAAQLRRVTG